MTSNLALKNGFKFLLQSSGLRTFQIAGVRNTATQRHAGLFRRTGEIDGEPATNHRTPWLIYPGQSRQQDKQDRAGQHRAGAGYGRGSVWQGKAGSCRQALNIFMAVAARYSFTATIHPVPPLPLLQYFNLICKSEQPRKWPDQGARGHGLLPMGYSGPSGYSTSRPLPENASSKAGHLRTALRTHTRKQLVRDPGSPSWYSSSPAYNTVWRNCGSLVSHCLAHPRVNSFPEESRTGEGRVACHVLLGCLVPTASAQAFSILHIISLPL